MYVHPTKSCRTGVCRAVTCSRRFQNKFHDWAMAKPPSLARQTRVFRHLDSSCCRKGCSGCPAVRGFWVILKSIRCLLEHFSRKTSLRSFSLATQQVQYLLAPLLTSFYPLKSMAVAKSPPCTEKGCVQISQSSASKKSRDFLRRDSPESDTSRSVKSDNATVAIYDVKNNQFRTIKRREAASP